MVLAKAAQQAGPRGLRAPRQLSKKKMMKKKNKK
jgi:hypothetical protein